MIILYRPEESAAADAVQETLEELVLAHRVEVVSNGRAHGAPDRRDLPVLVEGDDEYSGTEIQSFLEKRANRLSISRRMSADACFLDPDDPSQCI